ncbi:hypothetical protein Lesp02_02120 [Lentzea sp. NBRC 105346]|uniref:hypothetical protein n=1 Tax=Lentzea sp. NBRC 105346 TaxID=3032205 RepID=UPI00249FCB3E|nr:hypothetical protein [Lentzea sp. NBRC 105346]GLZ28022.1 hypothetical protein Lesp02_02120 [Lentzea sp. NBRC 105346]
MRTHVLTRGVGADYRFLGSVPATRWWQEFRQLTSFERPTLLVHRHAEGWELYASAVPTERKDRMETVIRMSLVLSASEFVEEDADLVLALVGEWLAGAEPSPGRLGTLLDERFPAEDTEELLAGSGPDNDEEVAGRVRAALAQLRDESPADDGEAETILAESWAGAVTDAVVRSSFVRRVRSMLNADACGWAVQLTLAGAEDVGAHHAQQDEPLVALVNERIPGGWIELAPKAVRRRRPGTVVIWTIAVATAIVIGLITWVVHVWQPVVPAGSR